MSSAKNFNLIIGLAKSDEEIRQVYNLAEYFFVRPGTFEEFKRRYKASYPKGEHIYYARYGDEYAGSISVRFYPSPFFEVAAYVNCLVVHPKYRSTNVVDELFIFIEKQLRARGVSVSTFRRNWDSHPIERYARKYGFATKFIAYRKDRPEHLVKHKLKHKIKEATQKEKLPRLLPLMKMFNPDIHDTSSLRNSFEKAYDWGYHLCYLEKFLKPVAMGGIRTFLNPYWGEEVIINTLFSNEKNPTKSEDYLRNIIHYCENHVWSTTTADAIYTMGLANNEGLTQLVKEQGFYKHFVYYLRKH